MYKYKYARILKIEYVKHLYELDSKLYNDEKASIEAAKNKLNERFIDVVNILDFDKIFKYRRD